MSEQPIIVLDPAGTDRHAEYRALRERGAATRVDVLGVTAWSVSDPVLLKELLTSSQVSKDARAHWPAFAETVATWPLALWVAVNNMFTAYGGDHRRLRRMISPRSAPAASRTCASRWRRSSTSSWTASPAGPPVKRSICAPRSPTRSRSR